MMYLLLKRVMLHGYVRPCEGIHHCSHEVPLGKLPTHTREMFRSSDREGIIFVMADILASYYVRVKDA